MQRREGVWVDEEFWDALVRRKIVHARHVLRVFLGLELRTHDLFQHLNRRSAGHVRVVGDVAEVFRNVVRRLLKGVGFVQLLVAFFQPKFALAEIPPTPTLPLEVRNPGQYRMVGGIPHLTTRRLVQCH